MIKKGITNQRVLARLISEVENENLSISDIKKQYDTLEKFRFVIGITGPPGIGKSTVINLLINEYRKKKKKVGVIAIDPSSVKSKGAFLGDRVRMQKHSFDKNVFIRSMATRGHFGGVSIKTKNVIELFKISGFEIIIIETVGVGQNEVEVSKISDVVVTITSPSQGDEIQLLKAGIFEIADIFVVNKSDMNGADLTYKNLIFLSESLSDNKWKIPVIKMIANEGKGIKNLINSIESKIKNAKPSKQKKTNKEAINKTD